VRRAAAQRPQRAAARRRARQRHHRTSRCAARDGERGADVAFSVWQFGRSIGGDTRPSGLLAVRPVRAAHAAFHARTHTAAAPGPLHAQPLALRPLMPPCPTSHPSPHTLRLPLSLPRAPWRPIRRRCPPE
jgi:hypothetical protein